MSTEPPTYANCIGGAWQREPDTMPARNPATGETLGPLPKNSRETAGRAVAAAKAAAISTALDRLADEMAGA